MEIIGVYGIRKGQRHLGSMARVSKLAVHLLELKYSQLFQCGSHENTVTRDFNCFFILYLPPSRINRNFQHISWATEFDEAIWSLLVVNIYV